MTDNTNPIDVPAEDNLDDFAAELFGSKKEEAPKETDADDSTEEDSLATDATVEEEAEPEESETDESEDTEEEKKAFIPKKKKTFQERINEVIARQHELERELEAERAKNREPEKAPEKVKEQGPPDANEKLESGEDKYPLGDFDPQYIKDLNLYWSERSFKELDEKRQKEAERTAAEAEHAALQEEWQEKLVGIADVYPDFRDSSTKLEPVFTSVDPGYGEYLAATIMSMDKGPDVLYYLSQNLDEAQRIVEAGPTRATIALGELHAMFRGQEKKQQKVSQAPEPPTNLNKGRSVAREIPDDTDDLDAFEKKFFKKR